MLTGFNFHFLLFFVLIGFIFDLSIFLGLSFLIFFFRLLVFEKMHFYFFLQQKINNNEFKPKNVMLQGTKTFF